MLHFFFTGIHCFTIICSLRLIRVFRVLNISTFENESKILGKALRDSLRKIEIFLYIVLVIVVIISAMMYFIEGAEHGFSLTPKSIYWAIVMLTTVRYGDISSQTGLGQFLVSTVMIIGYAIIAVPAGIVSAEMVRSKTEKCNKTKNGQAVVQKMIMSLFIVKNAVKNLMLFKKI
ncbi:MAG: ion transporter [Bacteroidales bacterium]|nr:ion transporter [Bacteroidales bacterium]